MESNNNENDERAKILRSINQNVLDMTESFRSLTEQQNQLNGKSNHPMGNVELQHEILNSIMSFLSALVTDYIGPVTANKNRAQLQKKIIQQLQDSRNSTRIRI